MTIAEGEEMIAVAKQHGRPAHVRRRAFFTPKYLKAKEMADAGAFGRFISSNKAKSISVRTALGSGM